MPIRIPTPDNIELTQKRIQTHAKKNFIGRRGVKEIRATFKNNFVIIEVVKEAKEGITGRLFGISKLRGVAKLARCEFQGPNKWKFFIYSYENSRYETYKAFREGTIEDCLDTAGKVFSLR